jgi:hypothetical protein
MYGLGGDLMTEVGDSALVYAFMPGSGGGCPIVLDGPCTPSYSASAVRGLTWTANADSLTVSLVPVALNMPDLNTDGIWVRARRSGTVTITAKWNERKVTRTITIVPRADFSILPANRTLSIGQTYRITCATRYSGARPAGVLPFCDVYQTPLNGPVIAEITESDTMAIVRTIAPGEIIARSRLFHRELVALFRVQ